MLRYWRTMPNEAQITPSDGPYERLPVSELLLDAQNPRLIEYGIEPGAPQSELLQILWEEFAIKELAMSIAYSGYFTHEPLFVERNENGLPIVIEGNRRLAAVMLLLSQRERERVGATDLPNIDELSAGRRSELQTLPVIETTREDVWRYLGFKHVNGPSSWGSYAKAQYIAQVHNEFGVPLDDIATQIGDYSNTVRRMYRGLMVIEQAENAQVFSRKNVLKSRFYFNYIYSAVTMTGVRDFLSLDSTDPEAREPVPNTKIGELGELCLWLYGDATRNVQPIVRTQNPDLAVLDSVLKHSASTAALKDGFSLDVAKDIREGDDRIFRRSVLDARISLQRAHSTLSTGYASDDTEVFLIATEVEELASDLIAGMRQKKTQARRRVAAEAEDR